MAHYVFHPPKACTYGTKQLKHVDVGAILICRGGTRPRTHLFLIKPHWKRCRVFSFATNCMDDVYIHTPHHRASASTLHAHTPVCNEYVYTITCMPTNPPFLLHSDKMDREGDDNQKHIREMFESKAHRGNVRIKSAPTWTHIFTLIF
jgi:hypothetical protein